MYREQESVWFDYVKHTMYGYRYFQCISMCKCVSTNTSTQCTIFSATKETVSIEDLVDDFATFYIAGKLL